MWPNQQGHYAVQKGNQAVRLSALLNSSRRSLLAVAMAVAGTFLGTK